MWFEAVGDKREFSPASYPPDISRFCFQYWFVVTSCLQSSRSRNTLWREDLFELLQPLFKFMFDFSKKREQDLAYAGNTSYYSVWVYNHELQHILRDVCVYIYIYVCVRTYDLWHCYIVIIACRFINILSQWLLLRTSRHPRTTKSSGHCFEVQGSVSRWPGINQCRILAYQRLDTRKSMNMMNMHESRSIYGNLHACQWNDFNTNDIYIYVHDYVWDPVDRYFFSFRQTVHTSRSCFEGIKLPLTASSQKFTTEVANPPSN